MVWRVAWSLTAVSLPLAFTHPSKSSCTVKLLTCASSEVGSCPVCRGHPGLTLNRSHRSWPVPTNQVLFLLPNPISLQPGEAQTPRKAKLAPSSRKSPILSFPRPWSLGQATLKQLPSTARVPRPRGKTPLASDHRGEEGTPGRRAKPSPVPPHRPRCHLRSRGAANLKPSTQHNSPRVFPIPVRGSPSPARSSRSGGVPPPKLGNRLHS